MPCNFLYYRFRSVIQFTCTNTQKQTRPKNTVILLELQYRDLAQIKMTTLHKFVQYHGLLLNSNFFTNLI